MTGVTPRFQDHIRVVVASERDFATIAPS